MANNDRDEVNSQLKAQIGNLFASVPSTYPQIEFHLAAMSREFRSHVAKALQPQLNTFLASRHPKTRSDYSQLTSMIDHTLTNLGLCLSNNGKPAILTFYNSNQEEGLVYALMGRAENRLGHKVISLGKDAPEITIMAAPDNTVDYLQPLRDKVYNTYKR